MRACATVGGFQRWCAANITQILLNYNQRASEKERFYPGPNSMVTLNSGCSQLTMCSTSTLVVHCLHVYIFLSYFF